MSTELAMLATSAALLSYSTLIQVRVLIGSWSHCSVGSLPYVACCCLLCQSISPITPVVGTAYLPKQPLALFQAGKVNDVSIIIGSVSRSF